MRFASATWICTGLLLGAIAHQAPAQATKPAARPMPVVPRDWSIELVAEAPKILFPTAIVASPDGTVYLGQDPMDMPGPPTRPIDSVVAIKDGQVRVFADGLWAVMGLEWADGTLYVVHAPFLSAFKDTDGDGKADQRVDLMTGLGPRLPGFSGINDHVASGVRLGMDGFLYISVGDKGIPKGVGRDGKAITLFGGGVIRIRPDGTDLEVVSTGERNPLSVALTATDDVFTYGNDDDSKRWPNSLTHHIVGAHFGYPYEFLTVPDRTLPITAGQIGGSGTQGLCYNEAGLPDAYKGNLFFTDWGLQTVFRYAVERSGATYKVKSKEPFVTKGDVGDFRPFSMGVSHDGKGLYLVDWAFMGWLASGPQTGRLYKLTYTGGDAPNVDPEPAPAASVAERVKALDHPSLAVRLRAQRALADARAVAELRGRLSGGGNTGRLHALWALDAIGTPEAAEAIRSVLADADPEVRAQAARRAGIRRDKAAATPLASLLRDPEPVVRREAAIALGKIGEPSVAASLYASIGDRDPFVAWSVRKAIRALEAWDASALLEAFRDPKRRENTAKLTDEAWATPVVEALKQAIGESKDTAFRARLTANLAGIYRKYPAWSGNWFGTNPLAGEFPRKSVDWDPAAMKSIREGLVAALNDPDFDVRQVAIVGLQNVGKEALPALRDALEKETDALVLQRLALAVGRFSDVASIPALSTLLLDPKRSIEVREAAHDALLGINNPRALSARLSLIYEKSTPAELLAWSLPSLGKGRFLPANDLAPFLEHASASVRIAALQSFTPGRPLPTVVRQSILARLDDPDARVKAAALDAVAALQIREALPRLIALANDPIKRAEVGPALTAMPDPSALPIYLSLLNERSPETRRAAESALLAIREQARPVLEANAKAGAFLGPAALAVERILTRFVPIADWKVIGPFARTTAQVFIGEPSIDFRKAHSGAEGRTIVWLDRKGDPATGRVIVDDFKGGNGDKGGFGYDTNGSPDLASFAYAEIVSDKARPALLQVGSSGSIIVNAE